MPAIQSCLRVRVGLSLSLIPDLFQDPFVGVQGKCQKGLLALRCAHLDAVEFVIH